MTARLLLDERYSESIAAALRQHGHDVVAVVSQADLRGAPDADVFRWAAVSGYRVVTENIKDVRPLLADALAVDGPAAPLLLVPPRRFPRGRGDRAAVIVSALERWLTSRAAAASVEDWLVD